MITLLMTKALRYFEIGNSTILSIGHACVLVSSLSGLQHGLMVVFRTGKKTGLSDFSFLSGTVEKVQSKNDDTGGHWGRLSLYVSKSGPVPVHYRDIVTRRVGCRKWMDDGD